MSRGELHQSVGAPEDNRGVNDSSISKGVSASATSVSGTYTYLIRGPLQALLEDESIEEIWINSPNRIFMARHGKTELVPLIMSAQEIRDLVERLLAWTGRRVDLSQPFVDARLPNGSRLHVVIPDITAEFWTINIRKRALRAFTLDDLVSAESVTTALAELLRSLIHSQINILVSGATQAGKTTVLNCLLGELPITSRLITIEEVFELMPRVADHVGMQTRQVNLEGDGEVTLRMLVREALRMRPTHIVIGEVRGAEALDLLLAFNSGIPGMASIHANSPLDALRKISALPLLAGANIVREFALDAVRANVDLVIHCERDQAGKRRVMDVSLVQKNGPSDSFWVDKLIAWNGNKYLLSPVDIDSYPKVKGVLEKFLIQSNTSARL